ncbi:MAG: NosD domain-containing protein [Thermoplasmata archaeon]
MVKRKNQRQLQRTGDKKTVARILGVLLLTGLLLGGVARVNCKSTELTRIDGNENGKPHRERENILPVHPDAEIENGKMDKIPHIPIHINGDADFSAQAANEGWSGDGTAENPYLIEGYEIDGGGGYFCIWIENTTVHFQIKNCYLWNATDYISSHYPSGILLTNVTNAKIIGNMINSTDEIAMVNGISLFNCNHIEISSNTISNHSTAGVFITFSSDVVIENNYLESLLSYGVFCEASDNITVNLNKFRFCGDGDVWLQNTTKSTISRNKMEHCYDTSIHMENANENYISSNLISNSSFGLYIFYSNLNKVEGNVVYDCTAGIVVKNSSENEVVGNNVSNSIQMSIYLIYSGKIYVGGNTLTQNGWDGITVKGSTDCILAHNNISKNLELGICVTESNGLNISSNNISGNGAGGILLYFSEDIHLFGNNISMHPNAYGLCISLSQSNEVMESNFTGNRIGIFISCSDENLISRNNISDNLYGISILSSNFNMLTLNFVGNNTYYGVSVDMYDEETPSMYNVITRNIFWQNNLGTRGVLGNSQAYDNCSNNSWYDADAKEGNYWSNWDGNGWGSANAYPIDGGKASDWYPLGSPVSELQGLPLYLLAITCFGFFVRARKKHS